MSDSTRMSAVNSDLSSNLEERVQSPQALQGQQDGKPKPFKLNNTYPRKKQQRSQNVLKQLPLTLVSTRYLFLRGLLCVLRLYYAVYYFGVQNWEVRLISKQMLVVKVQACPCSSLNYSGFLAVVSRAIILLTKLRV